MLSVKSNEGNAIESIFNIIMSFITSDFIDLLGSEPSTVYLALFALIPFVWNRYKDQREAFKIAQQLAAPVRLTAVSQHLAAVGFFDDRNYTSIKDLVRILLHQIAEGETQLMLGFFIQVARIGTLMEREASCAVINAIAELCPNFAGSDDISYAAHLAVTAYDLHSSPLVMNFMRALTKNGILAQNIAKPVDPVDWPKFPDLPIPNAPWSPIRTADFTQFDHFTLIYLTDTGFSGSIVLRDVKETLNKVEAVPPFSDWHTMVLAVQLHEKLRAEVEKKEVELHLRQEFFQELDDKLEAKRRQMSKGEQ
jgi:hypothetical protein